LRNALVTTLDDTLICRVRQNEGISPNANSETLRAASAERKRINKTVDAYLQLGPRIVRDLPELVNRAAAAQALPPAAAIDPQEQRIQTSFDGQAEAIQRANERPLRIAVGAEGQSERRGFRYERLADAADVLKDGDRDATSPMRFVYDPIGELRKAMRESEAGEP
jgi:hypothetical protein